MKKNVFGKMQIVHQKSAIPDTYCSGGFLCINKCNIHSIQYNVCSLKRILKKYKSLGKNVCTASNGQTHMTDLAGLDSVFAFNY